MRLLVQQLIRLTLWRQRSGQDLIEYALMAGFVATAAGAVMPGFTTILSQIFSKTASVLTKSNAS
jgi:pilus assembly protein Flp/PilA